MYYAKRQAHDWDWQVSLQMYYCYVYNNAFLLTMYLTVGASMQYEWQERMWLIYVMLLHIKQHDETVVQWTQSNAERSQIANWTASGTTSTIKCRTKPNCKLSTASGTTSTVSQSHVWGGEVSMFANLWQENKRGDFVCLTNILLLRI